MDQIAQNQPKVVIIGTGLVGSTFAYALMISGLAGEIVLIDANRRRAEGEAMDLNHGISFVRPVRIYAGDYPDCAGADVVVITAGAAQKPGETRLELVHRNVAIFKQIIPQVVRYAQQPILLIVTNPVDIMSYVAYRLSGYPSGRVIGSGTVLDTSRLRYLLSAHCGVDPKNVHAYIIGEHGDSEVPLWSLANIAGMRLDEYCPSCERGCQPSVREEIFRQARDAAYAIIDRKGATYYGIGLSLLEIVESILRAERSIATVSTYLENYLGESDIYISVPAILHRGGVERLVPLRITGQEAEAFHRSVAVLRQVLGQIQW